MEDVLSFTTAHATEQHAEQNRRISEVIQRERRRLFLFVRKRVDNEGDTFKQLADETGLSMNTLLSRKRYATLHLRRRLQAIYEEFVNE